MKIEKSFASFASLASLVHAHSARHDHGYRFEDSILLAELYYQLKEDTSRVFIDMGDDTYPPHIEVIHKDYEYKVIYRKSLPIIECEAMDYMKIQRDLQRAQKLRGGRLRLLRISAKTSSTC